MSEASEPAIPAVKVDWITRHALSGLRIHINPDTTVRQIDELIRSVEQHLAERQCLVESVKAVVIGQSTIVVVVKIGFADPYSDADRFGPAYWSLVELLDPTYTSVCIASASISCDSSGSPVDAAIVYSSALTMPENAVSLAGEVDGVTDVTLDTEHRFMSVGYDSIDLAAIQQAAKTIAEAARIKLEDDVVKITIRDSSPSSS